MLSKQGAWDVLLQAVNEQLEAHQVVVKHGAIVDASSNPTPRKPKGTQVYELTEEGTPPLKPSTQPGVDAEGSWVKKSGKLQYGYKRHYVSDQQAGLVLSVSTTTASAHESKHMGPVGKQANLPPGSAVLADKGFASASNEALLKREHLKSRIQRKAYRNRPLRQWERSYVDKPRSL